MDPSSLPPRHGPILLIRPALTGSDAGGDAVMYAKTIPYLAARWDLDVVELQPVGNFHKLANMLTLTPAECGRFLSRANRAAVAAACARRPYRAAIFMNEVTFPCASLAKAAGIPVVLVAQNAVSLIAASDPGLLARAMWPLARIYERRYYKDPAFRMVGISRIDAAALARSIGRNDIVLAPPGPPPSEALAENAPLLAEGVITGSYDWWRKRRDLISFIGSDSPADRPPALPIYVADARALAALPGQVRPLTASAGYWSQGLRFGLVTDAFLGGFKLKSLEYIAKNCIVLSRSDIRMEFAGLPHAEEFVRLVATRAEAESVVAAMMRQDHGPLVARFLAFKSACLRQFSWESNLAITDGVLRQAAA